MKKSLLALAVVAVAASANAATVYDKDGTSLYLDGRVQSVYYSGNHNTAGVNDSSIQNSGRFGIGGKTQITDWVAGLGYAQWDVSSGSDNEHFAARDQYVGADFGEFGLLKAGRFVDSSYYAEWITDHYEDAADNASGNFNGERRGGQLQYTYENYGLHAQVGVQTAQDNAKVFKDKHKVLGVTDKYAVDSGFNASLGYTFDDVVFGPLSFRAGYSYIKGQKDEDFGVVDGNAMDSAHGSASFDKFKHANAGVVWGNLSSGLYLGALYDYAKFEGLTDEEDFIANGGKLNNKDDGEVKLKGFELIGGYAFDNGVSFLVGYEYAKYKSDTWFGDDVTSVKVKRVPVFVNYKINPNFNVWGEVGFNAGSDHGYAKNVDKQVFSLGARYTF